MQGAASPRQAARREQRDSASLADNPFMVGENVRRSFSRRRSSRTVDYQSERSLLLSKAFHAMDTYGEGALTPEDLLHRLRLAMYAHPLYKDKDFSTSLNVRDFDADGDGMITTAEFVQGMDSSLFDENDPASESVPTWVQSVTTSVLTLVPTYNPLCSKTSWHW